MITGGKVITVSFADINELPQDFKDELSANNALDNTSTIIKSIRDKDSNDLIADFGVIHNGVLHGYGKGYGNFLLDED